MPSVEEIINGLRERKVETPYGYAIVFAAVEEAVHAAADAARAEIIDALMREWAREGHGSSVPASTALRDLADLIARRFPNGGTNA